MLDKVYIAINGWKRVILVGAQKNRRVGKVSFFLEIIKIVGTVKTLDEASDRNEKQSIGNGKKGHLCYRVAKNLAELCSWPRTLWKNLRV